MTLEQQILSALRRIVRAIDMHSRDLARTHGLTGPQLVVLGQLRDSTKGLTVGELASAIELSQPTVTGIVNRLERRLMVKRARSRFDRRQVVVSITAAGQKVLDAAPPLLQQQFLEQINALDEWERTQILATLQRVVTMMNASRLDAAPILVGGAIGEEAASGTALAEVAER